MITRAAELKLELERKKQQLEEVRLEKKRREEAKRRNLSKGAENQYLSKNMENQNGAGKHYNKFDDRISCPLCFAFPIV